MVNHHNTQNTTQDTKKMFENDESNINFNNEDNNISIKPYSNLT